MDNLCRCSELGYKPGMSYEELTQLLRTKRTCTDPRWICRTVERYLAHARIERDRKEQYSKRKKHEGGTAAPTVQPRKSRPAIKEVDVASLLA